MLSFRDIKEAVSIVQAAHWLGIETHKEGHQQRGYCPFCDKPDNPRSLALTPAKGIWFNHCPHHRAGGSVIDLASKKLGVSLTDAAKAINEHFRATTPENKPVPSPDDELKPLDHLIPDHALCTEMGFSKEVCERIGAGYARKGVLAGRFLLPVRLPDGKLIGYVGISPKLDPIVKLPSRWR